MLFDFDLVIPAGTLQVAPTEQIVKLTRGKIIGIRILFPPGPATLVHVSVLDRLHQLIPANPDGDINFDDAVVVSKMAYEMNDVPYELYLRGWSPAAIYAHTITFQFDLVPLEGESWGQFTRLLFAETNAMRRR